MELKRQIEFDKKHLFCLQNSINETNLKFNETLKLVAKLTERLGGLRELRKDFEVRIKYREGLLVSNND